MAVRNRMGLPTILVTLGLCVYLMKGQGVKGPMKSGEHTLAYYLNANPDQEMVAAIGQGDHRFLGIGGIAMSTPGVPHGAYELVRLHGTNFIEGTSDGGEWSAYRSQFQEAASEYAAQYNMLLYGELVRHPDAKTRVLLAQARVEIGRLEGRNPTHDARRAYASNCPQFIMVSGEPYSKIGLPERDKLMLIPHYGFHPLIGSTALFAQFSDQHRVRQLTRAYVAPYNRTLYSLLQTQRLKRAQQTTTTRNLARQEPSLRRKAHP